MATKEKMKEEAINRMKNLQMDRYCVAAFRKGNLWQSENGGILYEIENDEELKKAVKEFENEYGGLVYHIVFNHTEFGDLYSMLYVSKNDEEWLYDNEDLKDGYTYAYVWNKSFPEYSEIGSIGIVSSLGGLRRIV